jgi:hypothetical protein
MDELMKISEYYSKSITDEIRAKYPFISKHNAKDICYEIFMKVLHPSVVSTMSLPPITIPGVVLDKKNAFCRLTREDDRFLFAKSMNTLRFAAAANAQGDNTGGHVDYGAITRALEGFELATCFEYSQIIRKQLLLNPTSKHIIMGFYHGTNQGNTFHGRWYNGFLTYLADFNPILLTGKSAKTAKKKQEFVDLFRCDPTRRLMICNEDIAAYGWNMHDTVGNAPRTMWLAPTFKYICAQQAASRIYRDGIMSKATVRIMYGADDMMQVKILTNLQKKNVIVEDILDQQVLDGVEFIGDLDGVMFNDVGIEEPYDWRSILNKGK